MPMHRSKRILRPTAQSTPTRSATWLWLPSRAPGHSLWLNTPLSAPKPSTATYVSKNRCYTPLADEEAVDFFPQKRTSPCSEEVYSNPLIPTWMHPHPQCFPAQTPEMPTGPGKPRYRARARLQWQWLRELLAISDDLTTLSRICCLAFLRPSSRC